MADNTPRTSSIQIGRIIEALIFSSAEPVAPKDWKYHGPAAAPDGAPGAPSFGH